MQHRSQDEGYEGSLRQIGTYQWYEGPDPREPENPSSNNNDSNLIKGWMVKDPKGYWLPNKIFFNPKLSGPATVEDETTEPSKGRDNSRFNHFSLTPDKNGNLPFFIERDTNNFASDHDGNPSVEKIRETQLDFFAFDPYGSYRDTWLLPPQDLIHLIQQITLLSRKTHCTLSGFFEIRGVESQVFR